MAASFVEPEVDEGRRKQLHRASLKSGICGVSIVGDAGSNAPS
jgi:hypothetical protein